MIEVLIPNTDYIRENIYPMISCDFAGDIHLTLYDNYVDKLKSALKAFCYDLVITTDVDENDRLSAIFVCKRLRDNIPIIHIPDIHNTDYNKDLIRAFKRGVDDYIKLPCSHLEIAYRIKSITDKYKKKYSSNVISFCGFELVLSNRHLRFRDCTVELTSKEFGVLYMLFKNPNEVVTTKCMLQTLWNKVDYYTDKSLRVVVTKLRGALKNNNRVKIETVRGVGYKLIDITNK